MQSKGSTYEGRTLDDAVKKGLQALGLSRAEVMITVMEEGSSGFLGLGARPYKVRVMPRPGGAVRDVGDRPSRGGERGDRERGRGRGDRAGRTGGDRGGRGERVAASGGERTGAERSGGERSGGERTGGREGRRGRDDRGGRGPERPAQAEGGREGRERGPRREGGRDSGPRAAAPMDEGRRPAAREEQGEPRANHEVEAGEPRAENGAGRRDDRGNRRRGRRGGRGRGGPGREGGRAPQETMERPESFEAPRDDAPPPRYEPAAVESMPAEPVYEQLDDAMTRAPRERFHEDSEDREDREGREGREGRGRRESRAESSGPGMSSDELVALGRKVTEDLLKAMGFEGKVEARAEGDSVEVTAEVSDDEELLTGRKGEVRQALQHLLNRMVNRGEGSRYHLQLEINDFWRRREEELEGLARSLADEAATTGSERQTEYLNAQERRIVHVTLREDARVKTYAIGDGLIKKVAVAPAGDEMEEARPEA